MLRTEIFRGDFRPGDPLPELHLAKRFGVSQAIIREALSSLSHAGLVRRFPNKGTFVTSLTPTEIGEYVRLRLLLETTAWTGAAERATTADFDVLAGKLKTMSLAVEARDYDAVAQADLEFHRQIWRMSGDSTLFRLLDQITVPLFAFVSLRRSRRKDDLSHLIPDHQDLIEVIRQGDQSAIISENRRMMERSYLGFLQPSLADAAVTLLASQTQGDKRPC